MTRLKISGLSFVDLISEQPAFPENPVRVFRKIRPALHAGPESSRAALGRHRHSVLPECRLISLPLRPEALVQGSRTNAAQERVSARFLVAGASEDGVKAWLAPELDLDIIGQPGAVSASSIKAVRSSMPGFWSIAAMHDHGARSPSGQAGRSGKLPVEARHSSTDVGDFPLARHWPVST